MNVKLNNMNVRLNNTKWLAYRYRDWEILTWNTGNGINLRIRAPGRLATAIECISNL